MQLEDVFSTAPPLGHRANLTTNPRNQKPPLKPGWTFQWFRHWAEKKGSKTFEPELDWKQLLHLVHHHNLPCQFLLNGRRLGRSAELLITTKDEPERFNCQEGDHSPGICDPAQETSSEMLLNLESKQNIWSAGQKNQLKPNFGHKRSLKAEVKLEKKRCQTAQIIAEDPAKPSILWRCLYSYPQVIYSKQTKKSNEIRVFHFYGAKLEP